MEQLDLEEVKMFVETNITDFHQKRLKSLEGLKLKKILARKNPYLFKAKNILTSQDLIKILLDSFLSSQEETIFGDFLEKLAIFVCSKVYSGHKSSTEGIDLEFEKDGIRYLVSIKSGPHWGNSSQISKMKINFIKAKKILNTNSLKTNVVAINGCCYGKDEQFDKGEYQKLCGQRFWSFISGNDNLYLDIIEPIGHKAKEKNEDFNESYAQLINKFTLEFSITYCDNGVINWEKLVAFNSARNAK